MRQETLNKALELFKTNSVLLEYATGAGKSYQALKLYESIGGKLLILVPQTSFIKNWLDEINKHDLEHIKKDLVIMCYASLKKLVNITFDCVICDECHQINLNRQSYINQIKFNRIIYLSATLTKENKAILSTISTYKTISITTDQAIESKILSEPTIYIHKISLTAEQEIQSKRLNKEIARFKFLYRVQGFNWAENKWLLACTNRKRWLNSLKTDYTRKIIKYLGKKKFICFTSSVDQCNELGKKDRIIHSKAGNNQVVIDAFNTGKIRSLYSVNIGKEGLNLVGIQAGIMVNLDGKDRSAHQVAGRCFRSKNPELHIIVLQNTRDEEYLNNVLENINPEYIKYLNL